MVNGTSFIGDQVFCKRMLTITYHKRTFSDLLPLTLQFILTWWISVEIQHALTRCFQTPAVITGKVTTTSERLQHFMMSMCEHRVIHPAHRTVKMAWYIVSIWWYCHKEPAKLGGRVHFLHPESLLGKNFPAPYARVCLISTGFPDLNSLWTLQSPLL